MTGLLRPFTEKIIADFYSIKPLLEITTNFDYFFNWLNYSLIDWISYIINPIKLLIDGLIDITNSLIGWVLIKYLINLTNFVIEFEIQFFLCKGAPIQKFIFFLV